MKTIIEPFRVKMVEPIRFTTKEERNDILSSAGYNLFQIKAEDVIVDLLTDSGTAAMSSEQWAGIMRGDESYAGCASFYRLRDKVCEIFGFSEVIPMHQGRAAERLLFSCLVTPGDVVPSNTHFDTTRANLIGAGAMPVDLPAAESQYLESNHPFKGNINIEALMALIVEHGAERIPFAMLTITNNACGGQPVSLANMREYAGILHRYGIPLYIDAARFAENAYLIQQREAGERTRSLPAIVKDMFALSNGCLMSAKKDGLSNTGAFIATNDGDLAQKLRALMISSEGFPTYGGLCGRDLEAVAVGLEEVLSDSYMRYREASAGYLAKGLAGRGVPVLAPYGMHAVYLDARNFFPRIPPLHFPGQALVCELYLEAGIRACEIGSVMFGQSDFKTGQETAAGHELVRLALPRRVYSLSHWDYVIEAAAAVLKRRAEVAGMKIVWQPPSLRHFTAMFEPLNDSTDGGIRQHKLTKTPKRVKEHSIPQPDLCR